MPRLSVRTWILVLGLWAGAGYLWLNVVLVWPYLTTTQGDFWFQFEAAAQLLSGGSPFASAWYDYPPLPALLLLPIAWMSFGAARLVWFLIGHLCLIAAALLLVRPLGSDRAALLAVAGVWLFGGTIQENLVLGQWNPVLLLLLVLALRFDASRPAGGAGVLGLAAAIKIWPGLLLAADLLRRRWRALAAGLAVALGGLLLPGLVIAALVPPPHLPTHGAFWMGSPAPLNLTLPAAVLRATYPGKGDLYFPPGVPMGASMPLDWALGNDPAILLLSPARRALSIATSLAVLTAGLLLLARRTGWRVFPLAALPLDGGGAEPGARGGRREADGSRSIAPETPAVPPPGPDAEPSRTGTRSAGLSRLPERGPRPAGTGGLRSGFETDGPPLLAALVALALLAAPIAWYHYQLLQLPGIAWLAAGRLRGLAGIGLQKKAPGRERVRAVLALLGLVALLTGLTRAHLWYPLARWMGAGELVAVQVAGWAVPALGIVLFGLLASEAGKGGTPALDGGGAQGNPG